ncbi:MAG: M23 family metallopeptidase [Treponema sp.]|nr:M23 family metallopeptidase [Treponema sp.]
MSFFRFAKKHVALVSILFLCNFFISAQTTHVVAKGETFYSISRKYGVTVDDIRKANNFSNSYVLKAGQKIVIPNSSSSSSSSRNKYEIYTVQKGDTFYGISTKNDMTVDELLSMNGLSSNTVLKAGQKLKVPVTVLDDSINLPKLSEADPRKYNTKKKVDTSKVWPVNSNNITYTSGKVSGVCISAKKDESVTCIRAGTVSFCGAYRGFGQVVFVQSKSGHIYAYTNLGSISVAKGDFVTFGDELGTAGIDALSQKSQIVLMVFQNGKTIDPATAPRG